MEVMDAVVPSVTSTIDEMNDEMNDDSPTVEETYEITTSRKRTIRTSYKIQEVSLKKMTIFFIIGAIKKKEKKLSDKVYCT